MASFVEDKIVEILRKTKFSLQTDKSTIHSQAILFVYVRFSGGYSNLGARGKNFQKLMLSEKKKRSDLGFHIFLPKSKCSLKQWSPTFLSPRTGLRLIILPRPTKREGETQIVFNLLVFEHAFKIKLFEP